MIQEVVGTRVGDYFLPGLRRRRLQQQRVPLVAAHQARGRPGRAWCPASARAPWTASSDDYPMLIAPGQPGLRVNVTADEIVRYSPQQDRRHQPGDQHASRPSSIRDLLRECGDEYPAIEQHRLGVRATTASAAPVARSHSTSQSDDLVVTFDGLIAAHPVRASRSRRCSDLLREKLGTPVDIEFASRRQRPLPAAVPAAELRAGRPRPAPIPRDVPAERRAVLRQPLRLQRHGCPTSPTSSTWTREAYAELREPRGAAGGRPRGRPAQQAAAQAPVHPDGPGPLGQPRRHQARRAASPTPTSTTPPMLIEIARKKGNYVPDLSFGTHFFQDLVESSIRYLPLYPDDPGDRLQRAVPAASRRTSCRDMLPEFAAPGATSCA